MRVQVALSGWATHQLIHHLVEPFRILIGFGKAGLYFVWRQTVWMLIAYRSTTSRTER